MSDKHVTCPYRQLPAEAYWRKAVAQPDREDVNPVTQAGFRISDTDKVGTAGSCFAQNIARYLNRSGYNYMLTEPPPPFADADLARDYNYGTFTARYGNVYTARQLLQLFQRAVGQFEPEEPLWRDGDRVIDPFRPQIQPNGFATERECLLDREHHMAAVRRMIDTVDVFVFTLGLTEAWVSRTDGAVFPVCPGCGAGEFTASQYQFHNFTVEETAADLRSALKLMRNRNPNVRIILTVSPVPLIATASGQHVLTATTYSKSVLRVVAQLVADSTPNCDYFPAYEIITGAFNRGAYFAEDLRDVTVDGVEHVMKCFRSAYMGTGAREAATGKTASAKALRATPAAPASPSPAARSRATAPASLSAAVSDLVCDEEVLAR